MMKRDNVIVELYQLTGKELEELRSRSDGHIEHIVFDVNDIDKAFGELKAARFETIEDEPFFSIFGIMAVNILQSATPMEKSWSSTKFYKKSK